MLSLTHFYLRCATIGFAFAVVASLIAVAAADLLRL